MTEFDKSVIKKLKEKKFDGKALVEMTPDTVKTVIPEKHRPMFLVCKNTTFSQLWQLF